jgi:chromate transporter
VGIFTFGGGLILLTFLQEHIVHHLQWLTPQEFLDGLALGRLTPGPIPVLAAFIDYKVSGLAGGHPSRTPYQLSEVLESARRCAGQR